VCDLHQPAVLVVGVGNELRGDDGAGLEVVRHVRNRTQGDSIEARELRGDPTELLDLWLGCDAVVIVDTMRSGASPGTILRLDASHEPLPAPGRHGMSSTHAAGLAETIELARALGRLPARVIVYAIEGQRYDVGTAVTDELEAIVPALAEQLLREVRDLRALDRSLTGFSAI